MMETIPFFDLQRELADHIADLQQETARVVASGWYLLGEEKAKFEKKYANYCDTKHGVGVANGLDAIKLILLGYKELGILKDGDEVILPVNTFIATALAVSQSGLKPILADCDPHTFNICPQWVQKRLTPKTKAIIAVHLYGQVADMKQLKAIAEREKILLIEDAAQAHGAIYEAQRAGNLGHAAAFSFYPVKNLGALGDAGAITTNDADLADMVRHLSNYGSIAKYEHKYKGFNSRLDEIQAAVLCYRLQYLDTQNERRRQIATSYSKQITNELIVKPVVLHQERHVYHQYVIQCKQRNQLQQYLSTNGIQTQIHYPLAIHRQEAYKEYKAENYPIAERLQEEILSLPIYPSLTAKEIRKIAEAINNFS